MAGRIMGQLMLTSETLQSQADLSAALQASAGAVSGTLRTLLDFGYVERISLPGIRKDYYRMSEEHWALSLEGATKFAETFVELTARGLELSARYGHDAQERLQEMHDLARIEETHIAQLVDAWRAYREEAVAKKQPPPST